MISAPVRALSIAAFLSAVASAETLVVDALGGGDFTTLTAAVDAASDGDVILIEAGRYAGFVNDKALTLIGEPGVVVGSSFVTQPSPGMAFVLADLHIDEIWFDGCRGVVVLENVRVEQAFTAPPFLITDCADARVSRCTLTGLAAGINDVVEATFIERSRVELVSCVISGEDGADPALSPISSAAPGIRTYSSRLHLAASVARGGDGVDTNDCGSIPPGAGGEGIDAFKSDLIISGALGVAIAGGNGGANQGACPGDGGFGVLADPESSVRFGAGSVMGGHSGAGLPAGSFSGGGEQFATAAADPVLELLGTPFAGATVAVRISGEPGSSVRLYAGFEPRSERDPESVVEQLTSEDVTLALGPLPPAGQLDVDLTLPESLALQLVWLQASTVTQATSDFERSNSVPLLVRR